MGPLRFLKTLKQERRDLGWKGLFKRRGWTLVVLFIAYYLTRDLILYVVLPLAVAAGLSR